jgi:hypothetical protein
MTRASRQQSPGECVLIVGPVGYLRREALKHGSKPDGRSEVTASARLRRPAHHPDRIADSGIRPRRRALHCPSATPFCTVSHPSAGTENVEEICPPSRHPNHLKSDSSDDAGSAKSGSLCEIIACVIRITVDFDL